MALHEYLNNDYKEKRQFPRQYKKLDIKFLYQGSFKQGITQNMSLGGVLFRTKSAILVNTPVQLVLELSFGNEIRKCILHGKVVRIKDDPYGFWPEIGCSFGYSSRDSIKLLNDFLRFSQDESIKKLVEDSEKKPSRNARRKDPRVPTWWTNPWASLSDIKRRSSSKKKTVLENLKDLFRKKSN
jgi:hypothetical protein